jgi:hypothetical protein
MQEILDVQGALEEIIATLPLPKDLHMVGLLLTGSYAVSEANTWSDIDLIAIVRDRVIWRKFYRRGEHDIDLFAFGANKLSNRVRDCEQPLVQIVAHSKILIDSDEHVGHIQQMARDMMQGQPVMLNPSVVRRFCHRIATVLDDCRSLAEREPNLALTLITSEIPTLVDFYFRVRRMWTVDFRKALGHIAGLDKDLECWLMMAMDNDESCENRIASFSCAVDRALACCGGARRYDEEYIWLGDIRSDRSSVLRL